MDRDDWNRWLGEMKAAASALTTRNLDVRLSVEPPFSEAQIASTEAFIADSGGTKGFALHPTIRAMNHLFCGFSLEWFGLGFWGRINLAHLGSLYRSSTRRRERWDGRWRVFDACNAVAQVMIRFDKVGAELAFRSTEAGEEVLTPLAISLEEYFALSLATLGLSGWQRFFGGTDDSDSPAYSLDHVGELLGSLQDISPPAHVRLVAARLPRATQRELVATWPELAEPYGLPSADRLEDTPL